MHIRWDKTTHSDEKQHIIQHIEDERKETIFMNSRKSVFKTIVSTVLIFALVFELIIIPPMDVSAATSTPKKCTITKIEQSGTSITTYWKNIGCYGYHVQVSEKKKFPSGGTYNAEGYGDGTSLQWHQVTGLSYGHTYYVRVRGYNLDGSNAVYGEWSSVKTVTVQEDSNQG